jgi:biopolymer transport protein ExbD
MAFSNNGGGYGSRRRGTPALSEINVTPFVDVVLVLLIIFMLTAHVMESGIEVNVPAVAGSGKPNKDLPVVTMTKEGEVTLNGEKVGIHDLAATINRRFGKPAGVYLRADKETIWDPIAQVTYELGHAGFAVNMVTTTADEAPKGKK